MRWERSHGWQLDCWALLTWYTECCTMEAWETADAERMEGLARNVGGRVVGPHHRKRMRWTSGHACLLPIEACSFWGLELQRHWRPRTACPHPPGVGQTRQLAPFAWEPDPGGTGSQSGLHHLRQMDTEGAEAVCLAPRGQAYAWAGFQPDLHLLHQRCRRAGTRPFEQKRQADVHTVGLIADIMRGLSRASAPGRLMV